MKKKILCLLIFSLIFIGGIGFTLVSCDKDDDKPKNENVENGTIESGYVMTYPTSVSGALHNKGMGWIALEEQTELGKVDLGTNGTLPEIDNIGIQTCWDIIEPEEGVFNWKIIDQSIDYWTSQGKRINFRICTDSLNLPEVYFGAPRWLNEEPYNVHYEEYVYAGTTMARVNDLTDPNYQYYFERFLKELSDRYATNPYIDTIDIRGYGMYGEWHSGHSFADMEERMFTLAYIVDKYAENFAKEGKTLFLSNSWDFQGINDDGSSAATSGNCAYEDYLAWSAIDHAMSLEYIGFRRDGMAGNGVTKYSTDEKALSELMRSGKKVASCGEFYTGFADYIDGLYGMDPVEATEELLFKSRCNYSTVLGWVNSEVVNIVESGYEEVFNRGNEKMGYRFKVDMAKFPEGVKQGQTAYILTKLSNSGLGRFTLTNHNLRLMLVDSNGVIKQSFDNTQYDLRTLLNGETMNIYSEVKINNDVPNGKYTLAVAIVDENKNPSIRLAQVGGYQEKIYPLGVINIGDYNQLDKFYEVVDYKDIANYNFEPNSSYEITFEYEPSFKLEDFKFADTNGYVVSLKANGGNDIIAANFQDVSEEKAMKTVSIVTGNAESYKLNIQGTGSYANKISVGKVYITKNTGYIENFENGYNLLSTNSPWYCDNENAYIDNYDSISDIDSVIISGIAPHTFSDALFSDPSLLKLKPNSSYTISFKTKGYTIGGNACYYYLKAVDSNGNEVIIGEWYDRPDEPLSTKSFTFITPTGNDIQLIFGVKNIGGYIVDDINIVRNYDGNIIVGNDITHVNNVRPVKTEKLENGYVEGFEGAVLNDSTFTYGFNRWGHLTNKADEVISGNMSLTSELDSATYPNYPESNWFEFMYSNPKYIKLEANTTYEVSFKYKLTEHIYQNTDPTLGGYAYMLARSKSGADADTSVMAFAKSNTTLNEVYEMTYTFTTGNADDYYIILGLFGRGILIVDDISISTK